MVLDPLLGGKQDFMVKVHHVFCLLGHALVIGALDGDAFSVYFAGVVALEVGSGSMNVWLLKSTSNWRATFFFVAMSTSNAVACCIAWEWAKLPMAIAPKALCLVITAALVVLRQQACIDCLRHGPPELRDAATETAQNKDLTTPDVNMTPCTPGNTFQTPPASPRTVQVSPRSLHM